MEQQPLPGLLAGRAFPELASVLRAAIPGLLSRWEALVRQAMPEARRLSPLQLRDDAPRVLEFVAGSLGSDQPRHTDEFFNASIAHGAVRFSQNFNLAGLLIEYNLLRAALIDEVASRMPRPLEVAENVAINAALDVMTRQSVQAFVDHQSRELQAATEAQSKYLSFLSHDLRGGLNGVFLMTEVLKRELAEDPRFARTVEDLDTMRRSLLETVSTMDRFLHAERFRKGKVELKPTDIQVRQLLNEAASQLAYQARDKGLEIRVDAAADCNIRSDRELLSLIIQNLLSNAVKYTNKGQIELIATPMQDGQCLITVKDRGPGIEPERLNELFAPFARGETHGQPGVGLGLSIARQAAQLLGAKLWAESKPGQGSVFHVQIPSQLPTKV